MSRVRPFLALVTFVALVAVASAQDFKLVAHPSTPESSLRETEVSRIFLKKVTSWSDGTKIVPVDQPRTSELRRAFSDEIHHKSPDAIAAYWQKQIFSGRDVPPLVLQNDTEVLAYVRLNPGAVGYVASGASTQGVKVIEIVP